MSPKTLRVCPVIRQAAALPKKTSTNVNGNRPERVGTKRELVICFAPQSLEG